MKKLIIIMIFILSLPLAFALYGGEIWTYNFPECKNLEVNITATDTIDEGEYIILNDCTENGTNHYFCDCSNGYDFNVSFHFGAVNNYTFDFNYDYLRYENDGGKGRSSSSSSRGSTCSPKWNCSDWSDCQPGNKAKRTCTNTNNCNLNKPKEERYCYYPKNTTTTTEPIKQKVESTEQIKVEEPQVTEQEQTKEGLSFGWIIAIITFSTLIILIIIFFIISGRKDGY